MEQLFEDKIIRRLVAWGQGRDDVRAMILTSTRAYPGAPLDLFSDYDVIVAVEEIGPYCADRSWLEEFGPVLVVYRDPITEYLGLERCAYVTQYEGALKIDFTIWTAGIVGRVGEQRQLPKDLDLGYVVLLDKVGTASTWRAPSHIAFIPKQPAAAEFAEAIEVFFHEGTYAAKYLWRDDLMAAKHILDHMVVDHLRPMLEWLIEIEHEWSVKTGAYGRGIKKLLRPELYTRLESCYAGAEIADNWQALFNIITLFRFAAAEVAEALGFAYPDELDGRATAYLEQVRALPGNATSFT